MLVLCVFLLYLFEPYEIADKCPEMAISDSAT